MEVHVYGQDFAGHVVYSDSVFYSISAPLFAGIVSAVIIIIAVVIVLGVYFLRRRLRPIT